MARIWLYLLFSNAYCTGSSACPKSSVQIADGVCMPLINLGGVHSKPSNYTLWLQLGGRGLDTAWSYGDDVQKSVGEAVAASGISRSDLFITTKVPCCPDVRSFGGYACSTWSGKAPGEVVTEASDIDLRLLGLSYADLILLHEPCDTMESTIAAYKALESVKANGKARAIGISNFNASTIETLVKAVSVKPAVNQCGFSIAGHNESTRGRDMDTLHHCQNNGITYSAYSPLGGLSGVDVLHDPDVEAIAKVHNRSTAEIALRWVVQQGVVAVTAGDKESHDKSDLDIFSFTLSDVEMDRLTAKGTQVQVVV
eukprot:TRINITY_DN22607_c0_g2_i1.p1 TRINITY_DN22607_c0_g2~~TRINITY_DN22607_c0_g2_i1.p1  ORF type:complete len:312 (+),score=33.44 TRINITY_DN22607_c0_g2_i1:57-992(+)